MITTIYFTIVKTLFIIIVIMTLVLFYLKVIKPDKNETEPDNKKKLTLIFALQLLFLVGAGIVISRMKDNVTYKPDEVTVSQANKPTGNATDETTIPLPQNHE